MATKPGPDATYVPQGERALSLVGVSLLSACAPTAPATKPAEPAKPAEAPKRAEAAKPAPTGRAASRAGAAKPAEPKIGTQLIGKLEGPTVVTDPPRSPRRSRRRRRWPSWSRRQAAARGERIGQDPLVIKPVHEIGKYGGTWRRGFTGPATLERLSAPPGARPPAVLGLHGEKVVPNIARGWEVARTAGRSTSILRAA